MAYLPVAVAELARAGILDECRRRGTAGRKICWRRLDGGVIAEMERVGVVREKEEEKEGEGEGEGDRDGQGEAEYENLVLGQQVLAEIILKRLEGLKGVRVLFGKKVVEVLQRGEGSAEGSVVVVTQSSDGEERFEAAYVVGADGGRSSVRKLIGVEWEGFTWPEQLVATNVYYPFDKYGYYDANFIW